MSDLIVPAPEEDHPRESQRSQDKKHYWTAKVPMRKLRGMTDHTFFATAPNGITDLLATELADLGLTGVKESRGGVHFAGTIEAAYRTCLFSRLANRVLLPLKKFPAESPEALYDGVRSINWAAHLNSGNTLAVDANVSSSKINHSQYAALKIKDAVVDWFSDSLGVRPSVDVDQPDIRLNCYIFRDEVSLYLDLSGTSLHQRNYRQGAGQAPLKENLAAAILMRARWSQMAASGGSFVDLMCGSGTLVIEAGLIAADIAPGLTRDYFGFLNWQGHQDAIWQRLLAEAEYRKAKGLARLPPLMGFDVDRRVLDQARINAETAGIGDKITFAYQDIFDFRHDFPASGLMASNPPYGKRLGETGELPAIYQALGRVIRENMRGWKAAIFTEDQSLGKHIGIKAEKLHTLYNGAIVCKLIHFSVAEDQFFRDNGLPRAVPEEEVSTQGEMFRNRLLKNMKQIQKWTRKEAVTCYRIYDADLPDYSAAIDIYESATVPGEKWVCVQEYEAPATIDPKKAKFRTREMLTVTKATLALDDRHLFYKTRTRQRGESQYEKMAHAEAFHEVQEGNARLLVNFEDYLDTGLFLDHRPIRERIGSEARGKKFLNLFAYTGAASVHAALGGARSTTTVDMSKTYLDWAQRNLRLNGFSGKQHLLIQEDCLKWISQENDAQFDLIFLDPPTFSNSKRMAQNFDVQRDHPELIRDVMRLLNPYGTLYFSTNLRNFKLDKEISQMFAAENISSTTIPTDFKRRQNIHHAFRIIEHDVS